jgi:hypothetical protein
VLRELSDVRQIEGGRPRRWFQSGDEDLIVWYAEDGTIYGFQLCYDRQGHEKALTWMPEGYSHNRIDAGEGRAFRYKGTPLLVADGRFDDSAMTRRFLEISTALPPEISEFVLGKIADYPRGMQSAELGVRELRSASEAPRARAPQRDTLAVPAKTIRTGRTVMISIALILVAGLAYWVYGYATAEQRMKATCAAIKPGMSFTELKEFARQRGLLSPQRDSGLMYLAEVRSFGRHACKVLLEQGIVKHAEHNYAD